MNRLSIYLLALALIPAVAGAQGPGKSPDPRMPLVLNAEEAAHISGEMRVFLSSVRDIVTGIAQNDLKRVAEAAKLAGMAAAHDVPPSLRQKLPMAFKQLGRDTHVGFDDLARDAASMGDPGLAMQQLGQTMNHCVACHATFRLETHPGHTP